MKLTGKGHKVAVVAIDPSSSRTGGSILGDKTRMTLLSREPRAFVRPSPTRGTLGGLAQHTNDVILLCEAAGHDVVIIETVGLGQSEVAIDDAADVCMLLLPPAAGDDLQGVKKGIMEIADLVVVNKADGEFEAAARKASLSVKHAMQLVRPKTQLWKPAVLRCSALGDKGVDKVWNKVLEYQDTMNAVGEIARKRSMQNRRWMLRQFQEQLLSIVEKEERFKDLMQDLDGRLVAGKITPRRAASKLLEVL